MALIAPPLLVPLAESAHRVSVRRRLPRLPVVVLLLAVAVLVAVAVVVVEPEQELAVLLALRPFASLDVLLVADEVTCR